MSYSLEDEWATFVALRDKVMAAVATADVTIGSDELAVTENANNPRELRQGIYMIIGRLAAHTTNTSVRNLSIELEALANKAAQLRRQAEDRFFAAARELAESRATPVEKV